MSANKDTSITNPFREIVQGLESVKWQTVTLDYLDRISALLHKSGVSLSTYGEVFRVLEFLHENGAIILETQGDLHIVRKVS